METYQALKPKSYWLMVDKIKAYNKLQELKRNISEFLFVVGLFGSAYLLLILGNI